MWKTIWSVCLAVAVLILLSGVYISNSGSTEISFTEENAQQIIGEKIQKKPFLLNWPFLKLKTNEARVNFIESTNAKAEVFVSYELVGNGLSGQGTLMFETDLLYNDGAIFFRNVKVIDSQFVFHNPNMEKTWDALVKNMNAHVKNLVESAAGVGSTASIAKIVSKPATKFIQSIPVYQLSRENVKEKAVVMSVASLRTDNHAAHFTLKLQNVFDPKSFYITSAVLFLLSIAGLFSKR